MAATMLIAWPLVAIFFHVFLGSARGLIWSVTVAYLFLPESYGFDLPGLPEYEKGGAIALGVVLGVLAGRRRVPGAEAEAVRTADPLFGRLMILLIALYFLSTIGTWITNTETLIDGPSLRFALGANDVFSMAALRLIPLVPFLFAWRLLDRPEHHRELLLALVVFGLVYTLLVLFEVRMSPQLNKWIYGYFPHAWRQHIRGGGFRPLVFLNHGLSLGFFLLMVVLAALTLLGDRKLPRGWLIAAAVWTLVVLMLSRNLGATMLAFLFVPLVLLAGPRLKIGIAVITAVTLLSYPVLKQNGLAPVDRVVGISQMVSVERSKSLVTRLENEEALVARSWEKPWFGWGLYGRSRIFDERGRDQTLIDGGWIVLFSQGGGVAYVSYFGFLSLSVFFLRRARRRKEIPYPIAGMSMIMAANFIYLIPNSTLNPIALMIFGAMAAFVQRDTVGQAGPEALQGTDGEPSRRTRYSRFPVGEPAGLTRPRPAAAARSSVSRPAYRR